MKIGLLKRSASYIFDAIPILMLVLASVQWFAGDMIKGSIDNFDQLETEYLNKHETYTSVLEGYEEDYGEGLITSEELSQLQIDENAKFLSENRELIAVVVYQYISYVFVYVFLVFGAIYTGYQIAFKGQTLGRKLTKIELQGKTKWHNIIVREFLWKHLFWTFTFGMGLLVDIGLIVFTDKKKTLRDTLSHTKLAPEGVDYPF